MHLKMKHIQIKFHFLWEQVAEKNIRVEYVGTKEHIENIFTKSLPKEAFEYLCHKLLIIFSPQLFFNDILICNRFTRGGTVKRTYDNSGRGSTPRESSVRGRSPDGKLPLPLMWERFIICMERQYRGMRGVMVIGGA
jgi:hypothetical protein